MIIGAWSEAARRASCPPFALSARNDHLRLESAPPQLIDRGELVDSTILAPPEQGKVVRSDGRTAPMVTDGPFLETKEWLAGYQIVDVESEQRALEIAGRLSSVPGQRGIPIQQPIQVRPILDEGPSSTDEMREYASHAEGVA